MKSQMKCKLSNIHLLKSVSIPCYSSIKLYIADLHAYRLSVILKVKDLYNKATLTCINAAIPSACSAVFPSVCCNLTHTFSGKFNSVEKPKRLNFLEPV